MKKNFKRFQLTPEIEEALDALGYDEPTPIQIQAIPVIMAKKDIVGQSQTGSGKTAAFAIPICEKVIWDQRAPQALVLEPTRELAMQVKEDIFTIGRRRRLKVPVIFGGMPMAEQINELRQRSHIVVGTPGRILDHIRRETINLALVKYLVIDEADVMLDMGFLDDVKTIIETLEVKPVVILFSATIGGHLESMIEQYMDNPVRISVTNGTQTVKTIAQTAFVVEESDKYPLFLDLFTVENPDSSIVFCNTRDKVNILYNQMKKEGIRCGKLHGAMDQRERLRVTEDFRRGKFLHLITSDVAARGVDFPDLTHVFNYDFPEKRENYVHRIGRTGRIGKDGRAISLVEPGKMPVLREIEDYTKAKIEMGIAPTKEEVEAYRPGFVTNQTRKRELKEKKGASLSEDIMKIVISGGKNQKMRPGDLVGTLCNIDGIDPSDIGIIDIRETMSYVEVLNGKGKRAKGALSKMTIKGKIRTIKESHD